MVEPCIFCKIVSGEIPCSCVYEDSQVIAFLDINPLAKGHTLVVPKAHYPTVFDVPDSLGGPILNAVRRVGNALMKKLGAEGVNCLQNNFSAAGQMVFHAHWHVIPRFTGDGLLHWPSGTYSGIDEMAQLASSLKTCINES